MTIGRVGVWVCSPTKLKKKLKNKPKAEQETAQPTAAQFNKEMQNQFSDSFGFKNLILDFLKEMHP